MKLIHTHSSSKNKNLLQDIWKRHIDVQEKLLQRRSIPINIIPESVRIVDKKLNITVDEYDKTAEILDEISEKFHLQENEICIEKSYFLVDTNTNITEEEKKMLSEKAEKCFVKFLPNPIIDGYVREKKSPIEKIKQILQQIKKNYSFDKNDRLQISLIDFKKLRKIIDQQNIDVSFPEKANIILRISPNPIFYLQKRFPNINFQHQVIKYENQDKTKSLYKIEVFDGYFKDSFLSFLEKDIDMSLYSYDLIFYINPDVVSRYNVKKSKHELPEMDMVDNSFTFHTILRDNKDNDKINQENYDEEKHDFRMKYYRLKKFFDSYFEKKNVSFIAKFTYNYNRYKFDTKFLSKHEKYPTDFWNQVYTSLGSEGNISISEKSSTIGIDFNWEKENIDDILMKISQKCPFINYSFYGEEHKCNIDFQLENTSLDKIEDLLRKNFPSIHTKRDNKNGEIYFYQEYTTSKKGYKMRQIIEEEISLLSNQFDSGLYPISEAKEKYFIEVDSQLRKEEQETAIMNLRGVDFYIEKEYIGKLLKINYPQMIFDISGINSASITSLFEDLKINTIQPNLKGEIEKIKRLKMSLDNILEGENLQNPKLREFLFDVSKAEKTPFIDEHIDEESNDYKELEEHLLNKKINDSQKQAIIKALLAQDLALIQGPPGTGKSTAIAEIIWQHIRKNRKERILLTSETNLAVDNAIDRIVNSSHNLVKPIRIGGEDKLEMEGRQFSIDVMKRWVESGMLEIDVEEEMNIEEIDEDLNKEIPQKVILQNWIDNVRRRVDKIALGEEVFVLWDNILSNPPQEIRKLFYDQYVRNCNLIGATCSSIGKLNSEKKWTGFYRYYQEIFGENRDIEFTTIIQDEASKATPAELSLPLVYGKKNIVIGDHRQLPPLLDKEEFLNSLDFLQRQAIDKEEERKIEDLRKFIKKNFEEMEMSHFQRLFEGIDDSLKGLFNLQYRMHPDINDVIKQFYIQDGGLECGLITPCDLGVNDSNMGNAASRYHGINIPNFISEDNHVIWIDTNSPEMLEGTSRVNYGEVEIVRKILTKFQNSDSFKVYQSFWSNIEDQQIGIISFYGKQIKLLRELQKEYNDIPIRVSTVDRFQGMERNIIIVSMVRSNCIATDKRQRADIELYGELGYPEQKDLGFAQSPNRLNVALSRAKRLLIIVGNSQLFRQKEIYNNVYQTILDNPNGKIIKYDAL